MNISALPVPLAMLFASALKNERPPRCFFTHGPGAVGEAAIDEEDEEEELEDEDNEREEDEDDANESGFDGITAAAAASAPALVFSSARRAACSQKQPRRHGVSI